MKGNLEVGDPRAWWPDALDQLAANALALRPEHVAGVYALPLLHKDPFDRVESMNQSPDDPIIHVFPLSPSTHLSRAPEP